MKVVEHSSEKYSPRTYHNAKTAQLTVAFANDFTTAGERLTKKAAGDRYVAIYVGEDVTESARTLFKHCRHHNTKILNVAGNGIYSLSKLGWTQRKLNKWVHDVIALVHKHWELEQIISGGQTGVDVAGGIAGEILGLNPVMTLPKGFLQRGEDHTDFTQTEEELLEKLQTQIDELKQDIL